MQSEQLSVLNFGEMNVTIYGTEQDPLIKCSDLLIHVLGYQDCSKANWFKLLRNDDYYVTPLNHGGVQYFTEQGIYKALMKSNKPIAEMFQRRVCDYIKQMRKQSQLQLEQAKKQIEDLRKPKPASIYKFMIDDEIVYIGKDTSIQQDRPQQHMSQRLKIITQYAYFDTFLATQDVKSVKWEVEQTDTDLVHDLEEQYIAELKPKYNQQYNDHNVYICVQCDPTIKYQKRACYEKHIQRYHQ